MVEASSSDINSISFSAWTTPPHMLVDCVVQMMTEFKILQEYRLKKDAVKELIKTIQNAYNQNPFHCWLHAISVTQMMYLLISKSSLVNELNTRVCHFLNYGFLGWGRERGQGYNFKNQENTVEEHPGLLNAFK